MVVHNFPVGVSSQLLELAADRLLVGHHQPIFFVFFPGRTGPGNRMRGSGVSSSVRERLSLEGDRFLAGPGTGPGRLREWQRGGGMQMLCLEALFCCCSLSFPAFSFCSGKQALWTAAMFQCPFCPSQSVLVKLCCHGGSAYQKATYQLLPFHWQPLLVGVGVGLVVLWPGGATNTKWRVLHCFVKQVRKRSKTGQKQVIHKPFRNAIAAPHGLGQRR